MHYTERDFLYNSTVLVICKDGQNPEEMLKEYGNDRTAEPWTVIKKDRAIRNEKLHFLSYGEFFDGYDVDGKRLTIDDKDYFERVYKVRYNGIGWADENGNIVTTLNPFGKFFAISPEDSCDTDVYSFRPTEGLYLKNRKACSECKLSDFSFRFENSELYDLPNILLPNGKWIDANTENCKKTLKKLKENSNADYNLYLYEFEEEDTEKMIKKQMNIFDEKLDELTDEELDKKIVLA